MEMLGYHRILIRKRIKKRPADNRNFTLQIPAENERGQTAPDQRASNLRP